MKIKRYDDYVVEFSDGSVITYAHERNCCEHNYPDFSILDFQNLDELEFYDYDVVPVPGMGFNLRLTEDYLGRTGKNVFIPCYSEQNGAYSTDLQIFVCDPESGLKIINLNCNLVER